MTTRRKLSRKAKTLVITGLVLVAAYALTTTPFIGSPFRDPRGYYPDAWLTQCAPPKQWNYSEFDKWTKVDKTWVFRVKAGRVDTACQLLAHSDFALLTHAQAADFDDAPLPKVPANVHPYLLKHAGLPPGSTEGIVDVLTYNRDVLIEAGALTHYTLTLEHLPIVAYLSKPPKHVYLTFSVAE